MARLSEALMQQLSNVPQTTQVDVGGSLLGGIETGQKIRGRNEQSQVRQQALMNGRQRSVILGQNIEANDTKTETARAYRAATQEVLARYKNDPTNPALDDELYTVGLQFIPPKDIPAYRKAYNEMSFKEKEEFKDSLKDENAVDADKRTRATEGRKEAAQKKQETRAAETTIAKEKRVSAEKQRSSDMPKHITKVLTKQVYDEEGEPAVNPLTGVRTKEADTEAMLELTDFKDKSGLSWNKALGVQKKFRKDPAMAGHTLGEKTSEGYKVYDDSGAHVGHWK